MVNSLKRGIGLVDFDYETRNYNEGLKEIVKNNPKNMNFLFRGWSNGYS